jgi:hypothetical protein
MKKNIVLVILWLTSMGGSAQQWYPFPKSDGKQLFDTLDKARIENISDLYLKSTTNSREFIFGREYIRYYFQSQTNPLLRFDEERSGSIVFRGRSYDKIVLQYDTYTDQVIYTDDTLIFDNRIWAIALKDDLIDRFDLYFKYDTLSFRYFTEDNDSTFNLKDGFYEVVYDSECKYLIKHMSSCVITEGIDEYIYAPVGFVKISNGYSKISSKKQFILLFGNKSQEIKKFLRQDKIRIRKPDKNQIARVLMYYEDLNSRVD